MHKLIALVGFINSGKNTAADFFVEKGFKQESFAAPLKDSLASIFNWDRELVEGKTTESRVWREKVDDWWAKKLNRPDLTPRKVLQEFGTNIFRDKFHDDIWIDSLESRINASKQDIVISDCRFDNEIQAIHKMGGIVMWIQRGPLPEWYNCAVDELRYLKNIGYETGWESEMAGRYPDIHKSEWAWLDSEIDTIISNNGTQDELKIHLDRFLFTSL